MQHRRSWIKPLHTSKRDTIGPAVACLLHSHAHSVALAPHLASKFAWPCLSSPETFVVMMNPAGIRSRVKHASPSPPPISHHTLRGDRLHASQESSDILCCRKRAFYSAEGLLLPSSYRRCIVSKYKALVLTLLFQTAEFRCRYTLGIQGPQRYLHVFPGLIAKRNDTGIHTRPVPKQSVVE